MNILKSFRYLPFALCLSLALWSCESRRDLEGTEEITVDTAEHGDTARVIKTGNTAEDQLEEFRGWLNEQAAKGDTAIRNDWPQVREKLRQRNAELEQKFDSLSVQSKEEFKSLQDRYSRWEERQERRQQQPLKPAVAAEWQDKLLREYKDLTKVQPDNVREAYLTFMGEVRTNRRSWSQDDWDYVDYVYSQLNQRLRQIEGQLRTSDKLKIRTLQAEYLTLEGAADTQSMLQGTR